MRWLWFLILSGCSAVVNWEHAYIAPEVIEGTVVQYVDEFFAKCPGKQNVAFVALVSRLPESAGPTAVGHCTSIPYGNVYLRLDAWLAYDDQQRRALVFHELYHCAMGLWHDESSWLMSSKMQKDQLADKTLQDFYAVGNCGG